MTPYRNNNLDVLFTLHYTISQSRYRYYHYLSLLHYTSIHVFDLRIRITYVYKKLVCITIDQR